MTFSNCETRPALVLWVSILVLCQGSSYDFQTSEVGWSSSIFNTKLSVQSKVIHSLYNIVCIVPKYDPFLVFYTENTNRTFYSLGTCPFTAKYLRIVLFLDFTEDNTKRASSEPSSTIYYYKNTIGIIGLDVKLAFTISVQITSDRKITQN